MAKNKKGKDKSPVAEPERKANETENEQIPEVVDLDSEVANSSLKCSNEEDLLAAKAEILELRALLLAKDKELMELKGLRSAAPPASSEDIQKLQASSIQFVLTYKKILFTVCMHGYHSYVALPVCTVFWVRVYDVMSALYVNLNLP